MENSKIEWTDHTINLWHGCTKVHEGCDNCYAETLAKRWKNDIWGNDKPRKYVASAFAKLNSMQAIAAGAGEIHRVFCGSMKDIFEKPMPLIDSKGNPAIDSNDGSPIGTDHLREQLFDNITAGMYPNLIFLLLTKRPSNINKMIPESWKTDPPKNVMFGTSPVNQTTALKLIPQLLQVNGKRFLSIEPQLDIVDITNKGLHNAYSVPTRYTTFGNGNKVGIEWTDPGDAFIGMDWVIQGGESGHHRRPFNLDWAYKMKKQCLDAGVPYFFKQIDKKQPIPNDLMIRQFPK